MSNAIDESIDFSGAAQAHQAAFAIGESVILADTNEEAVILAIHSGVAWVFLGHDGHETVDLSEMRKPDPSRRPLL